MNVPHMMKSFGVASGNAVATARKAHRDTAMYEPIVTTLATSMTGLASERRLIVSNTDSETATPGRHTRHVRDARSHVVVMYFITSHRVALRAQHAAPSVGTGLAERSNGNGMSFPPAVRSTVCVNVFTLFHLAAVDSRTLIRITNCKFPRIKTPQID